MTKAPEQLYQPEDERGVPLKSNGVKAGMTRDEIDRAAVFDGSKRSPNMRPKDASTVIILDDSGPEVRMLLGKRHENHKFMPGLFVFPGGRVDAHDGSVKSSDSLAAPVENTIVETLRGKATKRRARALALAAIRETYEEAGLMLGEKSEQFHDTHGDWQAFTDHGIMPTIEPFRLIARAITPPGRTRRFDAWFFITKASHIAHRLPEGTGPSGELQDLHWLTIDEALKLELPVITITVLEELRQRLKDDPKLEAGYNIPFFHMKGKTFLRELI